MSLKAGAERPPPGPLSDLGFEKETVSGKVGNLLLVFHFSTRSRGGGNVGIAQRFPRAVGAEENLPLVFLRVHNPALPRPSPSCCPCCYGLNVCEQPPFGHLHSARSLGIVFSPCTLIQTCDCDRRPKRSGHTRQLPQNLPRCGIPTIHSPLFSF